MAVGKEWNQNISEKTYLSHLYLLFPSKISGWKNFWIDSWRELLCMISRLISIISSTLLDKAPQDKHSTWLCNAPPKISLTTVLLPLKGSVPLRRNFLRRRHVLWQASITYRRNSWASSWRPHFKCSAKILRQLTILAGESRARSTLRDRAIRFSSMQKGQSRFRSASAAESPAKCVKPEGNRETN